MSRRIVIRTGYDFVRRFTLELDGVAEDLSGASLIAASLKSEDKLSELITDTTQDDGDGATWSAGEVVIRFTATQTAAIALGRAWIEVAVVVDGVRLPYEDIAVVVEKGWTVTP